MIAPTKHISIESSLIGVGAAILRNLTEGTTITALWEKARSDPTICTFQRLVLALADPRSRPAGVNLALKAGLRDAVSRLDRERRLPKVSQLLPQMLDQAQLPGIAKTIINAIPAVLMIGIVIMVVIKPF